MQDLILNRVYSFWDDCDDDTFRVGYYIGGNDDYLLFELITTRGYSDGLYLTRTNNVFRYNYDDKYTKRMERLYALQSQKRLTDVDNPNECSPIWMYNYGKKNHCVISIQTDDGDTISGFCENIADDSITIARLDEDGQRDGFTILYIHCIEKMRCDSGADRVLQQLSGN